MKQETLYQLLDLYKKSTKGEKLETLDNIMNDNFKNDMDFSAALHHHAKDLIEMTELALDMQKRQEDRMKTLDKMINTADGLIGVQKSMYQDKLDKATAVIEHLNHYCCAYQISCQEKGEGVENYCKGCKLMYEYNQVLEEYDDKK